MKIEGVATQRMAVVVAEAVAEAVVVLQSI